MATYKITYSDSLDVKAPEKWVYARATDVAGAYTKFFTWFIQSSGDAQKPVLRVQIEVEPDPVVL